jgi:uncharacterized protein RhaS with RHS repeats
MYMPEVGRFFTQDRFAEKYLDFSPYQYAANNPVLFIDVNGDSILINYKNDKIIYYNGELTYAGTNKQYQGKVGKNGELKGFVGKTARALDQIRTGGPVGKGLVDNLQNDSRYVQISQGTANITKGVKVAWDPSNTRSGLDTQGSVNRPAFIGLAHELAHANDLLLDGTVDQSTWFTTTDGQTRAKAEIYATHIENQIRAENGLNIREYYTQEPYAPARITVGNTSLHIQRKVNLNPIKIGGLFPITFTPSVSVPYKY